MQKFRCRALFVHAALSSWLLYHANSMAGHGCGNARNPRMQPFSWNTDGTPNFGTPVKIGTPIHKPAGE